jgi:putative endonuclease
MPERAEMGEDRRRSLAHLRGLDGERVALLYLVAKGYWPVARRYLSPAGEIDLIMRRGRNIVAVEVKARPIMGMAAQAITPQKMMRLQRALDCFRTERKLDDRYHFRCDAILIAPWRMPRHIVNAARF